MISIKGGVVSVSSSDTLCDTSISDATIVVDINNAKSEQEVRDWMEEHFDNVNLHRCRILTNDVYAEQVMDEANKRAQIKTMLDGVVKQLEPVVKYKAPLIERVVGNRSFWAVMCVLNVLNLFKVIDLNPTAWAALMAVTFGAFAANLYFGYKRAMRVKNAMKNLPMPPGMELKEVKRAKED